MYLLTNLDEGNLYRSPITDSQYEDLGYSVQKHYTQTSEDEIEQTPFFNDVSDTPTFSGTDYEAMDSDTNESDTFKGFGDGDFGGAGSGGSWDDDNSSDSSDSDSGGSDN